MAYYKTDPLFDPDVSRECGSLYSPHNGSWFIENIPPGARKRAEELLLKHLDDRQRRDWNRTKTFLVTSASGRLWRIARGYSHNLWLIKGDPIHGVIPGSSLCVHVRSGDSVPPLEDNVLAQKLFLESPDLESFLLRIAYPGYSTLSQGRI